MPAERGGPEDLEPFAKVIDATPPPTPKEAKKIATTTTRTTSPAVAKKRPPPSTYQGSYQLPYPTISTSTIRTLKWGHARDLMLPFLSEEEKTNIHKKTRGDLAKLLEARVRAGDVTPQQFWGVVGLHQTQQGAKKKKPIGTDIAEALSNNRIDTSAALASAAALASPVAKIHPIPVVPGMFYPRPLHAAAMAAGGGGFVLPPRVPNPPVPSGQYLYKYTLRVPASIWPSTNYPPGIVLGEPCPPSPRTQPCVRGTFHASAMLALGPGDEVFQPGVAKKQIQFIFAKLDLVLSQMNATHSDLLTMTAHVVDIHRNGRVVMEAHGKYMAGKGEATRSICAWTMIGVSGLMPEGCVVQVEVKAIVKRAFLSNLLLDRPSPGESPAVNVL